MFFCYTHRVVQLSPQYNFRPFLYPPQRNFIPTVTHSPSPQFLKSAVCFYGFAYFRHFIWVESYNMWPFVSDFFHLALCFQGSYMLQHVLLLYSFPSPNNILLYGNTTFCFPIQFCWFYFFLSIMSKSAVKILVQVCMDVCFHWSWVDLSK